MSRPLMPLFRRRCLTWMAYTMLVMLEASFASVPPCLGQSPSSALDECRATDRSRGRSLSGRKLQVGRTSTSPPPGSDDRSASRDRSAHKLPGIGFDEAIHCIDYRRLIFPLQSSPSPVNSAFEMAPVYKFALIQMQPKVSQSHLRHLFREPSYLWFSRRGTDSPGLLLR